MTKFVYKTYHPQRKAAIYSEQFFLHTLLQGKVDFDLEGNLEGLDGAIINIRVFDNEQYIDQFNKDISHLKWCLIIVTGNEHGTEFHKKIKHTNCKIWLQTPTLIDEADYFLGFGWPTDEVLKFDQKEIERIYDFSFAGQVNNFYRRDCAQVIKTLPNSRVIQTGGFNQGLEYHEYLRLLSQTKFAACPSAISTPDSFRIYEALEMGCVPVLDKPGADLFVKMWGNCPIMGVSAWDALKMENMPNFEEFQAETKEWWAAKKSQIVIDLFNQISTLA